MKTSSVVDVEPTIQVQIFRLLVDQGLPWQAAIRAGASDTPLNKHVLDVGHLYPMGTGMIERNVALVNGIHGTEAWKRAIEWMDKAGMTKANPRDVLALTRTHPNLNSDLGSELLYVVATETCEFMGSECAVRVWLRGGKREAALPYTRIVSEPFAWYAFIDKS